MFSRDVLWRVHFRTRGHKLEAKMAEVNVRAGPVNVTVEAAIVPDQYTVCWVWTLGKMLCLMLFPMFLTVITKYRYFLGVASSIFKQSQPEVPFQPLSLQACTKTEE